MDTQVKCAKCGHLLFFKDSSKLLDDWVIPAALFLFATPIAQLVLTYLFADNENRGQISIIICIVAARILMIWGIGFLIFRHQQWINRNLDLMVLFAGSILICLGLWLGVISITVTGALLALAGTMKRVLSGLKARTKEGKPKNTW